MKKSRGTSSLFDRYVKWLNRNFKILVVLTIFLTTLDVILKNVVKHKIKNDVMLYGITLINKRFTVSFVFFLYFLLFIISVYGIVKKNDLKLFIIPLIASTSNIIDRILNKAVIDYIQFPYEPLKSMFNYFNLSDAQITVIVTLTLTVLILDTIFDFIKKVD